MHVEYERRLHPETPGNTFSHIRTGGNKVLTEKEDTLGPLLISGPRWCLWRSVRVSPPQRAAKGVGPLNSPAAGNPTPSILGQIWKWGRSCALALFSQSCRKVPPELPYALVPRILPLIRLTRDMAKPGQGGLPCPRISLQKRPLSSERRLVVLLSGVERLLLELGDLVQRLRPFRGLA